MGPDTAALGRDVGREDRDPRLIRFLDGADDAAGVYRRDHNRVHPAGDEILDLGCLTGQIPFPGDDVEIHAQAVRRLDQSPLEVLIEDVRFCEQRHADLGPVALACTGTGGDAHGDCRH